MRSNVVFRPTVVIGLGGTGFGTVLKLKRHFIDAYGSVPPDRPLFDDRHD